jgi:hypothetical protein
VLDPEKYAILKRAIICLNEREIGQVYKVQKLDLIEYYGIGFEYNDEYLTDSSAFGPRPFPWCKFNHITIKLT